MSNWISTIALFISTFSLMFAVTPFEWKFKAHMWVINKDVTTYVPTERDYNLIKEIDKIVREP